MSLKLAKVCKKQIVVTSDFHYDLLIAGYIKPSDFLNDDSARKVQYAIKIIHDFENLLRDNKILDDY